MSPKARTEQVMIEEIGQEVVVYDAVSHQVHLLNATAAAVYRRCDGRRPIEELTRLLQQEPGMEAATGEVVLLALDQLRAVGLLEEAGEEAPRAVYSRKQVLQQVSLKLGAGVAAGALLLPAIHSLAAPPHAHASSGSF